MPWLTTNEIAAVLSVHPKHVYRLLRRGMPAARVGGAWRFDEDDVRAWATARVDGRRTPLEAPPHDASAPLLAANGDLAVDAILRELREKKAPLVGHVQADHHHGLALLARREVLVAGCHGDAPPRPELAWIQLVTRELGLAFRRGRAVRRASAVCGKRFASRPTSAGIRACFDAALAREGIDAKEAHADATLHASHRDAVAAVLRGEAEFALASRAWSAHLGLGFLSIATEGYGLVVPVADLSDPHVVALCEAARSGRLARALARQHGYDTRRMGEVRVAARA